ncbi:hypothetical protein QTP70_022663 [Hemibagrus guttatus]|uniref:C2H2-type domain-containing protein n=1 Tax=Hemibagrus guttatus TaxID=175788 RepID=A0AAE0QKN7_9TELE|nr:hypothetical protein QTP70_022663 [Hemibagrus guttatus]
MKVKAADFAQEADINPSSVYKCRHCPYVNSHGDERSKNQRQGYGAYRCKMCPYTHGTLEKLKIHYEKYHNRSVSDIFTPTHLQSLGIARHYRIKHNNVRAQPEGKNNVFKCALCSYTNPIRKGEKPSKVTAFSRKSIISHYVKRHPGVFPKKQSSSKLGRYFTVIYPKDPETPAITEDVELVEVKSENDGEHMENDLEWPQFNNELKRDFVTIQSPVEEGAELYQCAHCEIKFLTLPELSIHLMKHNEKFEKKTMCHEQRKELQIRRKSAETLETQPENKIDGSAEKVPIGYRCNFCVEIHPTLRAICNHLRKHIQYGEVKEGRVKQGVGEISHGIANGSREDTVTTDNITTETGDDLLLTMETGITERVPEHRCDMCDRVFMSMQGLRSHERSHSATAMINRDDKYSCQYCQFQSAFRHNLDRHVQSHHGHHKPFRCKLCPFKSAYLSRLKSHLHKSHAGENTYKCISCPFSTMTISQLKDHSLREHGQTLTLPRLRARAALRTTHTITNNDPQHISNDATIDDSVAYLEPPDVQQQLSHYQLASRNQAPPTLLSLSPGPSPTTGAETLGALTRPDSTLTCEFCEFSSGYMQSLRRHYRDRHGGKKLFKCKDCSFFTCYKSTFTLHVEAGHSPPSDDGLRELRCPFCLYHTKSKSHMIDHVLLHRGMDTVHYTIVHYTTARVSSVVKKEERVIPLEVSRSKLSRHLDGLIFRCHKCTFTCSSGDSLQQHIDKHDEPKPYECRLCYYDTKHQQQLEDHLRDEHKVIRNFELMGRVNLDQLDVLKEKINSEEEEEMKEEEEEKEEPVAIEEDEQTEELGREEEEMEEEVTATEEEGKQEAETAEMMMPCSPSAGRKFPCEFCGRTFSLSLEWERHVHRHGMTVNSNMRAMSPVASVTITDEGIDQSANTTEAERAYQSSQSESSVQNEDD